MIQPMKHHYQKLILTINLLAILAVFASVASAQSLGGWQADMLKDLNGSG